MRGWLRRNSAALALILVSAVAFVFWVALPDRAENLGTKDVRYRYPAPEFTVGAGQSALIDGVHWRARILDTPPQYREVYDTDLPRGGKVVMAVIERDRAGVPAGIGAAYTLCTVTAIDGARQWKSASQLSTTGLRKWIAQQGYQERICGTPGSFIDYWYIPADGNIAALDITLASALSMSWKTIRFHLR